MKSKIALYLLLCISFFSCTPRLKISDIQTEKNKIISPDLPEDPKYNSIIAPYKAKLEETMNKVISHTNVDLTKAGDNSNLGNLLADYTYEGAADWAKKNNIPRVDAAVINIGGIRSTIGKGDILLRHIYEVMPFENEVIIVKMKGSDVNNLFDYYAKTQKNNPLSHLYIETDGGKIISKNINGQEIELTKDYYIATSDYLALGGDNMNFFTSGEMFPTGIKLRDLFIEKFKENPEITVSDDVRILFKNKKSDSNE